MDTLDYALYGVEQSMLVLAQRAALDILDRVAVCMNDYLGIGGKPSDIYFRTFWRENGGVGNWCSSLQAELTEGNPGLIALGELASDLCEGSFLSPKRDLRNISTHRFCVLHDIGVVPSRVTPAVEHFDIQLFFMQTVESLQIVRSAILYLLDSIAWHEARRSPNVLAGRIVVLPHHYVRSEN